VSFNDWIRVPVPGNPSSLNMLIGSTLHRAFIDRVRSGDGWQTVAALRCPNLRPGEYDVKVTGVQPPVTTVIAVL
jgi:hypothetical protein